ncbi:hypothetical protein FQR65_LT06579 [Abscondita terminalis]|nr:hypothetical protein FQR65_LT06579 [Abscondita terminalis]
MFFFIWVSRAQKYRSTGSPAEYIIFQSNDSFSFLDREKIQFNFSHRHYESCSVNDLKSHRSTLLKNIQ